MTTKKRLKGQVLFSGSQSFLEKLVADKDLNLSVDWEVLNLDLSKPIGLKETLFNADLSILGDKLCIDAFAAVNHTSVGSHFLKYIDFISCENGKLWGYSVFSQVYKEVLLKSIQNQDFKGSVIFLGQSPLALPVIEVLASFGFKDFVFLELESAHQEVDLFDKKQAGLLGVEISRVDSAAFIQSQKEYSFCFVMESKYPSQTLEDMSYFHFLSSNSLVFDLIGESNFLFREVEALGVEVMGFPSIQEIWIQHLRRRVSETALKLSK